MGSDTRSNIWAACSAILGVFIEVGVLSSVRSVLSILSILPARPTAGTSRLSSFQHEEYTSLPQSVSSGPSGRYSAH